MQLKYIQQAFQLKLFPSQILYQNIRIITDKDQKVGNGTAEINRDLRRCSLSYTINNLIWTTLLQMAKYFR